MKNFTNNFKQITSRLSARWLILALMLLVGTSSAWANGFWGDNAWNIKFYSPDQNKDMWINDNYDSGHGASATIDLGTFTSAPYLKGYWAKTWGYGNDTNKYVKITFNNTTTSNGVSKQWDSNGDQMWKSESLNIKFPDTEGSHEESITFTINGAETMTCKIKYIIEPACTSCCTNYYLQHPWNGGNWTWKELKKDDCDNNIYTLTANYGNAGCDYSKPGVQEKQDYISNPTLVGSPQTGDECIFLFDATQKTITITKVVTCDNNPDFSVSLSKSEVAVGCTGVTASITGDDSPTVTWSSSNPSVATINSSTGAITIKAAGTTTIKATTTEAGGFCEGVEKPATLTVKSPSVTVTPNYNSLCEGETLTLTANLTNCGEGNSIQWYNGGNPINGATNTTLTINPVTTANSGNYKAVVSDGILCSAIESSINISVNALPSAPSLSNPEPICYGTPFTLPEKDDNKKTITWVGVDNRTLTGLTAGEHTYSAKIVENGCESTTVDYTITVKEQLAKPELIVTNVKQCGTNYTPGKIVINNYNPANTYILKKEGNTIDKTYNNGYSISENEIGTYTVEVSKDGACGATSDAKIIEVTNNTPTVTPFAITKQENVCMGNPVTLSYDGPAQSGTISYAWYEGDSDVVLGTEATLTIQQAKNASYKLVVTVTSNDCSAPPAEATTTVEPKAVPSAPTFDNNAMDACVNQQFTLPTPNNLNNGEEALWTVNEKPTTAIQTINVDGEYTYTAYKNDGCPSQGTPFIVRVNPLPTINIGEDVTAVKFEDVVLTATGNNIADVTWTADKGTITKDATDPTKAVLTYDQTGEVTVTATATSAAGCTSAATKTVTFSEETCEPTTITVPANYIEIYCKYNDAPTQHDMKVDIWKQSEGQGTESYQSCSKSVGGYAYWKFNITDDANYCIRISNKEINYKSGSMCTLTRGHKYYFDIPGGWSGWTDGPNKSKTQDITETQDGPPAITTPAVKMLSAFSEEGSGELSMTAQIVKTGCNGNMTYYFKYRLKGAQAWSQTTPQTATGLKAGDEINEIVTGLDQGGTYEIQAVINNNNEAVSNIIEYVVNIQETAISDVTLQLANGEGSVLQNQNQKYCVGSTAYIKLSYRGTAHKSLEWIAENELQPVNGKDKLFSYVVRGNETITANVANNENKGTPATGTIDINVYTIATTPDISIDRTEVCSTDPVGAKITVKAPQEGITYRAYKMVDDVETPHGDAVVADNAESIIINSIKETGTYYVKAWNAQCLDAIAVSLSKFAVTKIDASSNTIAISPETASTNPWMPVTVKVDKNSAYDYTLVCKQEDTDVTDQMVINKKGDSYVIKFPKPESAVIDKDGQVVFNDITYNVVVTLNGDVQCGTTSATSTVTLTNLIEDCD
ncbi:MAG: Ig-like domain-containing protein [Paludibacteraceae bacterium]|nr:Ig-like domain-containing protein [Paludibacteraceae bacterium]MBR6686306.1 Ig-like domain-containing protein [Paludibacteraceae bacterium]